jgi:hypothetical protein
MRRGSSMLVAHVPSQKTHQQSTALGVHFASGTKQTQDPIYSLPAGPPTARQLIWDDNTSGQRLDLNNIIRSRLTNRHQKRI